MIPLEKFTSEQPRQTNHDKVWYITETLADYDMDPKIGRPLYYSVKLGWNDAAELLLQRGADPEARTATGLNIALQVAAYRSTADPTTLEILLTANADVNARGGIFW